MQARNRKQPLLAGRSECLSAWFSKILFDAVIVANDAIGKEASVATKSRELPIRRNLERITGNAPGYVPLLQLLMIGACLLLTRTSPSSRSYDIFHGEPSELRTLARITRVATRGEPAAIIQFGLLLLIATPVARVVFSAAFGFEQDRYM